MTVVDNNGYAKAFGTFGLFLTTVVVSQILQQKMRVKGEKEKEIKQLRENYKMMRLRDRLSYTNIMELVQSSQAELNNIEATDEDVFDFIPKNSNWRHFEHKNEEDVESRRTSATNISIHADAEDEMSTSSTEDFLWTDTKRRFPSRSKLSEPLQKLASRPSSAPSSATEPLTPTWLDRISQSLRGLGDDGEATPSRELDNVGRSDRLYQSFDEKANPKTFPPPPPLSLRSAQRSASSPSISAMSQEITHQNRAVRAQYNARIMPNKVVMVRHGQSEGNVNEVLYSTTPDNAMRLTKLGWDQAREAGKVLKQKILASGEPVHFIVSPYVRTVETFHGIVSAWCDPKEFDHIQDREKRLKAWYGKLLELGLTWHEDPRIREQDFGNYQNPEKIKEYKRERHLFGPFFYRFPHGESACDVFDRVSTFLDSLWRSFDHNKSRNYVLVTHGISIRVLLARYFRYSIDQFSLLANPKNCEMVVLGHDGIGKLQLEGRCEPELKTNDETHQTEVKGYTFHQRLRVLPKKYIHKVNVRISHDDKVGPAQVIGGEKERKASNGDLSQRRFEFLDEPSVSFC